MDDLEHLLESPDQLLALDPSELALPVLKRLSQFQRRAIGRRDFLLGFPEPKTRKEVAQALIEAWVWLESEQMLAPLPNLVSGEAMFITRRGQQLLKAGESFSYQHGNVLPKAFLHPVLVSKVWAPFIRGEYDTAVFQAFKEVEISVRAAAKLQPTDHGMPLMRKAFDPKGGPLADTTEPEQEREAMAHLFAGAIGVNKNPHSHRNVEIKDPKEAAERIIFASHLLRIVDARSSTSG